MLLYPPDGVSRPFKISASRPAEVQVRYIERQFMLVHKIAGPDGTVPHAKEDEMAAAVAEHGPVAMEVVSDPAEAVRALAAALGVSLGGGVSESDHQLALAERDIFERRASEAETLAESRGEEIEVMTETIAALTAQRDELLAAAAGLEAAVDRAFEVLEAARV
jgi:hypothetical protein